MSKLFWKSLLVSPAVLTAFVAAGSAMASEAVVKDASTLSATVGAPTQIALTPIQTAPEANVAPVERLPLESSMTQLNRYGSEGRPNNMSVVTSVSQLSDVQPTDWAFQALQSLVERYGCIAGYPDGTYKGGRALSRYEFAAGLNACMDRVNELIAAGTADLVTKDDLAKLKALQDEFAAELATLRGRVDGLTARVDTLEAQQFSTTTKLAGEAIFAITDNFGSGNNNQANTIFVNRVRLNFLTSFTGKDTLWTRLQIGNAGTSLSGDSQGFQTFDLGSGGSNVILDTLIYTFPVGDKLTLSVEASAGYWPDLIPTLNPYFEDYDGGQGSLSTFAQRSPIYRVGDGLGAGILFKYDFSKEFSFSGGYMANSTGANPGQTRGLFDGSHSALGQLSYKADNFGLGLTYVRGYFTEFANAPYSGVVGIAPTTLGGNGRYNTDNFGAQAYLSISKNISLSGWFMYSKFNATQGGGNADVYSYAVGLAFPDLGKKGNLGGLFFGAQPYASGSNIAGVVSTNTPFHIEGFYKYQVSDNISITPGVIWLTAPGGVAANDDAIIGTIRTTFIF